MFQFFGQNSGTCIFSRHPIVQAHSVVFKRVKLTTEVLNKKGFVAAEIAIGNASALFVTTHFDSKDADSKKSQLKQLGDQLSLTSSLEHNVRVAACCKHSHSLIVLF
jgi:hypothetical protein